MNVYLTNIEASFGGLQLEIWYRGEPADYRFENVWVRDTVWDRASQKFLVKNERDGNWLLNNMSADQRTDLVDAMYEQLEEEGRL